MKKILLIIIKIFLIKSACFDACSTCDDTKIPTAENMQCITCADNYFKKHGTTNCYTQDEIEANYYLNLEDQQFYQCDVDCSSCYGGKIGDVNTNCKTCNNETKYYPMFFNSQYCKNEEIDSEYLQGYYLDMVHEEYRRCYSSCLKCKFGGDDNNHNCTECRSYYYKSGNNCYIECPSDLFIFGQLCVSECSEGFYLDIFSRSCLIDCPTGSSPNNELGICTIQTTGKISLSYCLQKNIRTA